MEYQHKELTEQIIGAFYDVYNGLGTIANLICSKNKKICAICEICVLSLEKKNE